MLICTTISCHHRLDGRRAVELHRNLLDPQLMDACSDDLGHRDGRTHILGKEDIFHTAHLHLVLLSQLAN
ncbi:hypothetical protein SDC9_68966 [bioreactor metagenome]|uniref:Uncharacterized protein n=1 Tax=bioreactor metagenome TaxID=1076179 RepID=A0A644Y3L3_9ZZZZ